MPVTLTSPRNALVKEIRQAVRRGALTESGFCVAEGFHLLEEAERSGCHIEAVLAAESVANKVQIARLTVIADELFDSLATTETSQGVLALVSPPAWVESQVFASAGPVVIVDGIQDPGNAGAILRVAEAFGAAGVLWLKGSANPFSPKALRASAGSCFRVPLLAGLTPGEATNIANAHERPLFAAMPHNATLLLDTNLNVPCAIAIGAEGRGVSPELAHAANGVRIPTEGVESLNAAVAAGILLYEAWRQRHQHQ